MRSHVNAAALCLTAVFVTESDARMERIQALGRILKHRDPAQLAFQIVEIAGDLAYQRHGVEVRRGDVVLDVGANVGVAAAFFALHCGAEVVHSFEPVPVTFDQLEANVAGIDACIAHPYGLSSTPGRAQMTYYPDAAVMSSLYADPERDRRNLRTAMVNMGQDPTEADRQLADGYEGETVDCDLRTVSSVLRDEAIGRVDLLKIDVERAELDVLAGIAQDDWPRIRQIAMEVHEHEPRRTIERDLRWRGFDVVTVQEPALRDTPAHMLYAVRQ